MSERDVAYAPPSTLSPPTILPYDPGTVGRIPRIVYAIKCVWKLEDGKTRTIIRLFASLPQYNMWRERVLTNWNHLHPNVTVTFMKGGVEWWDAEQG